MITYQAALVLEAMLTLAVATVQVISFRMTMDVMINALLIFTTIGILVTLVTTFCGEVLVLEALATLIAVSVHLTRSLIHLDATTCAKLTFIFKANMAASSVITI